MLEENIHILNSLLPVTVLDMVTGKKPLPEKAAHALAHLVLNTALNAIKSLQQNKLKAFDANPGDAGCQIRAVELPALISMVLETECVELKERVATVKRLIDKRNSSPKEQLKSPPSEFYHKHLSSLTISKEMRYLLQCYLLAFLRTPSEQLSNGIVVTKTDINKLKKLSKNIQSVGTPICNKIVEENQKNLSAQSIAAIHLTATNLFSLDDQAKAVMVKTLAPEQTHVYSPKPEKYEPKSFGCQFYIAKAFLVRMRETQGIVCLKNVNSAGEQFCLYLQAPKPGVEFQVLSDEECCLLPQNTPVAVIEAVVNPNKKQTSAMCQEYGLTTLILIEAAKQDQYEPGSTLEDVRVPEAKKEILRYSQMALPAEQAIQVDHIYLNAKGAI